MRFGRRRYRCLRASLLTETKNSPTLLRALVKAVQRKEVQVIDGIGASGSEFNKLEQGCMLPNFTQSSLTECPHVFAVCYIVWTVFTYCHS